MSNTAVIYTRVSSKEQEEEGYSIPAQLDFLMQYAKSKGLNVVKVYSESVTASKAGRVEFNKMLDFAKNNVTAVMSLLRKTIEHSEMRTTRPC